MITHIYVKNGYVNIDPEDFVGSCRRLRSFCLHNNLPDVVFKSQGGWYILTPKGDLVLLTRTLNSLTFSTLYTNLNKFYSPNINQSNGLLN